MSIWEQLTGYLSFSFVRYALIAGVLIALCSSLLGVTLVLKRFSVIGDGLSHVAFGALAIATVLRLSNNMLLVMPVTVVCAVILLCANQNAKIKGDAAIAMLSVSALAIGYLIQNLFSSRQSMNIRICCASASPARATTIAWARMKRRPHSCRDIRAYEGS